ncbi:MAG TPA: ATP-binding protein [Anaerolineaceae bacterium]|nr:ATP-binding protein [Anaerolineaceae bacterium]
MPTMIFPGNYESLEKIAEFVTAEARASGLNRTQVFAVETAVDEACSNIIEHAYGGEGIGDIHCTTISEPERFTIVLEDHGRGFDPATVPDPDLSAPLRDRKSHGLGFYMMCQWMDEVRFDFHENRNRLTMVKLKA